MPTAGLPDSTEAVRRTAAPAGPTRTRFSKAREPRTAASEVTRHPLHSGDTEAAAAPRGPGGGALPSADPKPAAPEPPPAGAGCSAVPHTVHGPRPSRWRINSHSGQLFFLMLSSKEPVHLLVHFSPQAEDSRAHWL